VKLHIRNLGRIRDAELDIRRLTVFLGPNHTNKTWSAYALYGIARNMARIEFSRHRRLGFTLNQDIQEQVENAADRLMQMLTEKPEGTTTRVLKREDVIQPVPLSSLTVALDGAGLSAILGIPDTALTEASAELVMEQTEFDHSAFSAVEVSYTPSELELEFKHLTPKGSALRHPYNVRLSASRGVDTDVKAELRGRLREAVELLTCTLFDDAAVLPAERKALVSMNLPDYYRTMISTVRESAFAAPVYDFLYMIDSARRLRALPGHRPAFALGLATLLEQRILRGVVSFDDGQQFESDPAPEAFAARTQRKRRPAQFDSRYSTDDGVDLAIHASASIVRAMAGLDVYLKDFCDRDGLLVIDEPEMNAHPEAQLEIIEFLTLLVHHDVRVVLTTHSPYIVDHLSNLMQASRLGDEAKRAISEEFKLGRPEAFLPPDDVAVYLFNESGKVEDILDREQGIIDLSSFSRPTEYMANLVNAIWRAEEDSKRAVEQVNAD
jgi:AAA domain, putative AbiEii toxin, Type IV TA system